MVQFAKFQGNTFSGAQKARPHKNKGFGHVVLCQKCNPRLNHAAISALVGTARLRAIPLLARPRLRLTSYSGKPNPLPIWRGWIRCVCVTQNRLFLNHAGIGMY